MVVQQFDKWYVSVFWPPIERERERERERDRQTDRQTDRDTEPETQRQREAERQTDGQTETEEFRCRKLDGVGFAFATKIPTSCFNQMVKGILPV